MREASAGVVMDGNLLVCGGSGMTTCRLWTENGWLEKRTGFNSTIPYRILSSLKKTLCLKDVGSLL